MATPPPSSGGKLSLTKKIGPLPMWGWIAVAVVGVILYRKLSGSSSSTAAQTGATSTNATVPTETVTTAAGTYSGPVGYDPLGGSGSSGDSGSGSSGGSGSTGTTTPTDTTTPGTTTTATPGSGGSSLYQLPGTTTLAGNEYYVLGGTQATSDTQQYNVSGGAPVYFTWTGNGTPTQGAPPSNAQGVVAYTPVSTPTSQIFGPGNQAV